MGSLCSIQISTDDTVSRCWDCIAGQTSYTCKLKQNLQHLRKESEQLQAKRADVNWKVGLAEQQGMKRLNKVRLWLSRVQTVLAEAEELIQDGPQEIQKLCCAGCFSKNCKSSYNFGKQVARKLAEIVYLKKEGDFERVAENELASRVTLRPTEPTVGLEPTLVKVWHLLEQNSVAIIGLYGLGGVGKTTLLTQINNKLSNNLICYNAVIWVVVSKDHTIENIQEKIIEKLGFLPALWENKRCDEKAIYIFKVLSKKKFVLLLDDVWERVDLIKVGIPMPNQANGSKLIFTTRLLEVCGEMEAHEKIKVECLNRDEAWKLFEGKVGEETLDSHPDIRGLAKQVASRCGGLPLALITIGRAMACKKMPQDWQYAIEVLKESPHKLARMDQQVYALLKFSYDSLPNDTMRSCLLYCSLYPEDYSIPIDLLMFYWFCEGFLDEFDSLSRARMQGHNIINTLLNACLLERGRELSECVKMHDVLRDMVLWIACECEVPEKKFLIQAGIRSIKGLDVKNWEGRVRISLANCGIEDLRGTPKCPNLQTLFLMGNRLKVIRNGFFQDMQHLRVLNLSYNKNLCELSKEILDLVALECLDLSHTRIRELPMELSKLSKLKVLLLLETYLQKIPPELICRLSELQVFGMSTLIKYDDQDEDNVLNGGNEGLIEELKCLQHLNLLLVEIKSACALDSLLSFNSLRGCTEHLWLKEFWETEVFSVSFLANMEHLESLIVRGCKSMEKMTNESGEGRMIKASLLFPAGGNIFTPCFFTLRRVALFNCDNLKDLMWLILAPNLTWLLVVGCSRMEEIISEVANEGLIANRNPFAKLETLELMDLPELKSIYWDTLPFLCLRRNRVFNCPKLKKLPLNFDSGNQISIEGYKEWWEELQWKDDATRSAFLHSFKCMEWWKDLDLEDKSKLCLDFFVR